MATVDEVIASTVRAHQRDHADRFYEESVAYYLWLEAEREKKKARLESLLMEILER